MGGKRKVNFEQLNFLPGPRKEDPGLSGPTYTWCWCELLVRYNVIIIIIMYLSESSGFKCLYIVFLTITFWLFLDSNINEKHFKVHNPRVIILLICINDVQGKELSF